jgi:hypothetical protein
VRSLNEEATHESRWQRAPSTAGSFSGVGLTAAVLFVIAIAAAVSVDVIRAGGSAVRVKGDEATYVGLALSLAYDGNFTYERRDLERFYGLYAQGPEGIFLKRGKQIRIGFNSSPPFLHIDNDDPDRRTDRLYYSKAMIYSVVAAPFVRLLGMNGFLVFHVLMLSVCALCGYLFLTATTRPVPALGFTLAFIFASCVPVYVAFLTPEIFNFSCVFVAYFFWAYKEVARPRDPLMGGIASDLVAAVLLGIATYSKPLHTAPLVVPLVLLAFWRGQWRRGLIVGSASVLACATLFLGTFFLTGEFNYQGGDRKQFYSNRFPFDSAQGTWDQRGEGVGTDDLGAQDSLKPSEIVRMLWTNVPYFLLGRHFGLVPYFFPGVVALMAWLVSAHRRERWRVVNSIGIALATLVLLVIFPYTWSGGGGPPGNRYYMSVYPAFFFLTPPLASSLPVLAAWIGGALFTAKMLVNPFASAKFPWEITERGWARRLPVEVTMARDLPVMLAQPLRGNITYLQKPAVKLYFLDQHATPPEPEGMWISGSGRAEIIVRTEYPIDHLTISAFSPIRTTVTVDLGAESVTRPIRAGERVTFDVPASGKKGFQSYAYLMSVRSTEGFTPRLLEPGSIDVRNLGAQLSFTVAYKGSSQPQ